MLTTIKRLAPQIDGLGEPHSYATLDGTVYFHADEEAFDYHIDVHPNYVYKSLCDVLTQAEWWGLELLDEDECEPEALADGSTRIFLTPITPVNRMNNLDLSRLAGSLPSQRQVAAA